MDKLYMFMFGKLPGKPTGLATSVLRRSKALHENGIPNTILAHVYNQTHTRDMEILRKKGILVGNVRYLYDDISGETNLKDNRPKVDPLNEYKKSSFFIDDKTKTNVTRVYNNGNYELFVWKNDDNEISWIDYLNTSFIREKRVWFDEKGYPRKVENIDAKPNKVIRTRYLDRNGYCYLSVAFKNEGKDIAEILYFNKVENTHKVFYSQKELLEYWLEHYIFNPDENNLVISEYAVFWEVLKKFELKFPKFEIVYTIHNSHYAAPYTNGSPLRKDLNNIFNNLDKHKNIIVLTNEQKQDIVSEFGNEEKFHVIPHHMTKSKNTEKSVRDPFQIITASRFDKIKNIEDAIKAFEIINKKFPETTFKIFGRGEEEENYKKLISDLNLDNKVKLMGFSTNIQKDFSESSISLYTSKYEGFCLSLAESMTEGCVPVTYNFKYGPKDIISDGIDGLICEKNPESMANAVISLLEDQERLKQMREQAGEITNKFSEERLVREWKELFNKLDFNDLGK